jgi:hypothetical protein
LSLFSILIDVAAKTADFESGMDRIDKRLASFADGIKDISELVSAGFLVEFGKHFIDLGDQIEIASKRAQLSVQAFQELTYAAKESGVGSDAFTTAITRMSKALSDAGTGAKVPTDALEALGLNLANLQGLSPDKQFELLADRISKLSSPADKARAEMELFGRSGAELGPLFEQGAAGIEKARKEAETIGGVFSEETIKSLEAAHKSIDQLEQSFSVFAGTLVGKVAPALTSVVDRLTGAINGDRVQQLQQEIEFLQKVQGESFASLGLSTYKDIGTGIFSAAQGAAKLKQLQQELAALQGGGADGTTSFTSAYDQLFKGGTPPGYQLPDLEVHPTARRMLSNSDIFVGFNADTMTEGEKAAQEVTKRLDELNELMTDGVITQDQYAKRWNAISDSLQEVNVTAIHMHPILSDAQKAWNDFTDDVETALKNTVQESGNFGQNLLRNLLQALEDRAIFAAIEKIGSALRNAFSSSGSTGAIGSFFGAIFGSYGGGKAEGGPLQSGKWYTAGEHGPEPIWGGGPGAFAMGYGGGSGGGVNFAPVYNIDARGATTDLVAALPRIMKQNNDALENQIITRLRRNAYGIG